MYFGNCVSSVAISRRSRCSVFKSKCRKAKRNGSCLTAYPVFRMPCCAISTKPLQPPRVGLDLGFHSKFLLPLQACNFAEGEHHRLHRLHQPCGWTVFFDGCRRGIVRQLLAVGVFLAIRHSEATELTQLRFGGLPQSSQMIAMQARPHGHFQPRLCGSCFAIFANCPCCCACCKANCGSPST